VSGRRHGQRGWPGNLGDPCTPSRQRGKAETWVGADGRGTLRMDLRTYLTGPGTARAAEGAPEVRHDRGKTGGVLKRQGSRMAA
jgi:hypothetical protein